MDDRCVSIEVGIRLIGSHGFNQPGFTSSRYGAFVTNRDGEASSFVETVSLSNIEVLGINLKSFQISSPSADKAGSWQDLTIEFGKPETEETAKQLLTGLSNGLSFSLAPEQFDAWYGNLVVEINWAALKLNKQESGSKGIVFNTSVHLSSKEHKALTSETLAKLDTSSLAEIFVDGMRSDSRKLKYLNWFLPIEKLEALATNRLSHLFNPVFPKANRGNLAQSSGLKGDQFERFKNFLNNPNHTMETRSEKLFAILTHLATAELTLFMGEKKTIDLETCKRLVETRNNLAHSDVSIDDELLYKVLFPLSCKVVSYFSSAAA